MTKTNGLFRDLAASIIANTPVEQFLFSPPDKAKYLKELSEQMPSDADIKRQQAPRSLKAEEAFSGDFDQGGKGKRLKRRTEKAKSRRELPRVFDFAGTPTLAEEEEG